MEEIWLPACIKFGAAEDRALKWLKRLQEKMSTETHRFFHNWNELILRKKEFLRDVGPYVMFAVLFQYYEFDVKRNFIEDNWCMFLEFCEDTGIEDVVLKKKVLKMLGNDSPEEVDGIEDDIAVFQDLDLIILGSPPHEYQSYIKLLRKEYSHLDDASYKQMRLKILQTFLTIPTIYTTKRFQDKFEQSARSNIKNEIDELKK